MDSTTNTPRISTGIEGLDQVLNGGLLPHRSYLVGGGPGCGKTTLGLHFLATEPVGESLFVTLGETETQLREDAALMGLSMDGIEVLDLSPGKTDEHSGTYSLLESWDVEGNAIHDGIIEYAQKYRPRRILIDSLSQMRFLSADTFQFRKQVMSLLRVLIGGGATVMSTSEKSPTEDDEALPFLSDGVINLAHTAHGRLCQVSKFRGSDFAAGEHFYYLGEGGITLFPRLIPRHHHRTVEHIPLSTGVPELDRLTGGGIERGTVTLLSGPTGVGKTTLGTQLMLAAAEQNQRGAIYNFDENWSTFITRCRQLGMPVDALIEKGMLHAEAIEPLHYHPDQFATKVRRDVEENGTTMVMLDSLSGYEQSVRGADLQARVHALCRYLINMGVTVILVNEVFSIAGTQARVSEYGLSYVADNILLLRYLEIDGELRKTVGVLKKRTGGFEKSLREFDITAEGINIGAPLRGLRGILSGTPEVLTPREEGSS
ncbi:circadian clock protein KaiC [Natronospira proteinivora]|uniref:non-specific serine/threonine protein kinase n=1 Tax=Natronospira proteinivora TaxID=1807133 RepID=A0ABT1G4X2_9GAMM|nr:ATPase domain-containing protein [Natronospira proteinivora]MCP1726347.1 circadian clock protein KaiC [Natronospira proteinivora]